MKLENKMPEDPLEALKYVYAAMREDWESKDVQGIAALQDDFDILRKLEPKFKALEKEGEGTEIYKQYREILKAAGLASASLGLRV